MDPLRDLKNVQQGFLARSSTYVFAPEVDEKERDLHAALDLKLGSHGLATSAASCVS
jgi:hypothetical protein